MAIPRTRGAVSGVLLILLGAFAALIPLVGPYFDFTIGSTTAWDLTEGHVILNLLPGIAVAVGGLLLLASAHRARASAGAWLAMLGGAWLVVGDQVSRLWNDGISIAGPSAGGNNQQVAEQLVFHDGLGVLIIAIASFAFGRLAIRSVRDAELAEAAAVEDTDDDTVVARRTRESGRFDREPEPVAVGAASEQSDPRTETLSAADRVRLAAREEDDRPGRLRRLFNRD